MKFTPLTGRKKVLYGTAALVVGLGNIGAKLHQANIEKDAQDSGYTPAAQIVSAESHAHTTLANGTPLSVERLNDGSVYAIHVDMDNYGAGQGEALSNHGHLHNHLETTLLEHVPHDFAVGGYDELKRLARTVTDDLSGRVGGGREGVALQRLYGTTESYNRAVCVMSGFLSGYTRTELVNMFTHLNIDVSHQNIDMQELRELVVNHEMGHCRSALKGYSRLINETTSDSYASLLYVQQHGNAELPRTLMNLRTIGTLNGSSNYVTAPAIRAVMDYGMSAQGQQRLQGLSPDQVYDLSSEIVFGPQSQREQGIADYSAYAENYIAGRREVISHYNVNYTTGELVLKSEFARQSGGLQPYLSDAGQLFYESYQGAIQELRGNQPTRTPDERYAADMNELLSPLSDAEKERVLQFQKYELRRASAAHQESQRESGGTTSPYRDVYGFTTAEREERIMSYLDQVRSVDEPQRVAAREMDTRTL